MASVRAAMADVSEWSGEIIVVDNASTDQTARVAIRGGARVVAEAHRQIARARNAGAAVAAGRWLIFVDADTLISAALLRRSLAELDSGECCGGGARIDPTHRYRSLRVAIRAWNAISRYSGWACGAYVFCTADAFRSIGGFDEELYASEEIRLSNALRRFGRARGMRVRILDETIVTSGRKLEWYGALGTTRLVLRTLCWPGGFRKRRACELWYSRPQRSSEGSEESPKKRLVESTPREAGVRVDRSVAS